jgi:hypothetical protein
MKVRRKQDLLVLDSKSYENFLMSNLRDFRKFSKYNCDNLSVMGH